MYEVQTYNIMFTLCSLFQTLEPAKWTLNAIVFELEVIGENYFGRGRSLGISAPIVTQTDITNRLLNYMTFETPGPEEKKPAHFFTEVSLIH